MKNPNLLVSRVLKELYFKNNDLLDAICGNKASFIWRSIVWGKKLLETGCRWRVGSEGKIRILEDFWLFGKNGVGFYDPPYIPNIVFVSDLRLGNGDWNKEFLDMLSNKRDEDRIIAIPVGSLENQDEIIWFLSMDGNYSVRSGYREAIKELDFPKSSDSKNI